MSNRRGFFVFFTIFCGFILLSIFIFVVIHYKNPIKVGFCGVLSGIPSELGISARNGLKIAFDNINKHGGIKGRKLELIIKDDENNEDTGLQVVKEFHKEKVVAILGHITSAATGKSFEYINKNKILMISPTVSSSLYDDKDDYFIRVVSSSKVQSEHLAKKMIKDKKERVIVIYDLKNRLYTESTFNNFKFYFENMGGKILKSVTFYSGENNGFYDMIKELIQYKPDSFLLITNGIDTANICQQIRKFDKSLNIYAAFWAMTEDLLIYGGRAVEDIYIFGELDINDNSKEYVEFKEQYLDRYKVIPSFSAIYAYEAANLLFLALKKSKKWDADSLKETILKIKEFNGLQKKYIINQYGDTYRDYFLFTVKNGEFIKLE